MSLIRKREGSRLRVRVALGDAVAFGVDFRGTVMVLDVRLPGRGNSNSHGARPVHLIITMIRWIRTSRLSTKNSLSMVLGWLRSRPMDEEAVRR